MHAQQAKGQRSLGWPASGDSVTCRVHEKKGAARSTRFVHDGQRQPSIWRGLRNQMYLGGADFVAHMQVRLRVTESLDEIPRGQ
jgi:hypothetical protein